MIRAWRGVNSSSRAPALPQGLGPGRDCFGGGVASGAEAGLLTTRIALQESSVSASALCHLGLSVVLGIFAARSSVILQLFHSRNPGPKSQVEVSACLPWEPIKQDQAHRKRLDFRLLHRFYFYFLSIDNGLCWWQPWGGGGEEDSSMAVWPPIIPAGHGLAGAEFLHNPLGLHPWGVSSLPHGLVRSQPGCSPPSFSVKG